MAVSNSELADREKYAARGNNSPTFVAAHLSQCKTERGSRPRVMPDIATGTKRTFIFLSSSANMELSLGSCLC